MGRTLRRATIGRGGNDTAVIEHNIPAGAKKVTPGLGFLRFVGVGGTALSVTQPGAIISVYNSASTVGFVSYGLDLPSQASAPAAAGASSIPCTPNAWTTFCIGYSENPGQFTQGLANAAVRGSASTLAIYELVDDTELFLDPNS